MICVCVASFGRFIIFNPRRACAAKVTVLGLCVCVSVCLSVYDYSRSTGFERYGVKNKRKSQYT